MRHTADTAVARTPDMRRQTATVVAAAVLAGVLAVGVLFSMEAALAGVLACAVIYTALRSFPASMGLLLLASAGLNYGVLLEYRVEAKGILSLSLPISILDILIFLTILSLLINLLFGARMAPIPGYLVWPLWLYLVALAVGVLVGIANNNSLYYIAKDLRLHAAFLVSLLGTAVLAPQRRHLRAFVVLLLVAAFSVSIQQFAVLSRLAYGAAITQARDVRIPAQVLPVAIAFLMVLSLAGHRRIPVWLSITLHAVYALAAVLSFTRSVWAQLALTYVLTVFLVGLGRIGRILAVLVLVIPLLFAAGPLVDTLLSPGGSVNELMVERALALARGQQDPSQAARLFEMQAAWVKWLSSPILGSGLGAEVFAYDPIEGRVTGRSFLHNSVLEYALKTGILGLIAAGYLYAAGIRNALRMRFFHTDELSAHSTAVACAFLPFVLVGIWSGNLQHIGFAPLLGLLLGLNWPAMVNEEAPA
ncbi:MAG: O-antigen ligase family protein [Armatimonadota bacterium]